MSKYRLPLSLGLALVGLAFTAVPSAGQVGRSCSVFNQCSNGYSCQPAIQKCYNSPRREGQPCSAGFSCGAGLRCAAGVQKCVKENAAPVGVIEKGVSTVGGAVNSISCPDMQLKCPTGEAFVRGTSYDTGRMMCSPSAPMSNVLSARCTSPYASDTRTTDRGVPLSSAWATAASQTSACSAKNGWINVESQYSALFNDACIIHDLCYRAARQKASCDADMVANMQAVCYKLDVLMVATAGLSVGACLNAASGGYAAVSAGGQASYDGDQKEFHYPAGGGPAPTPPPPPPPVLSGGATTWAPCAPEGGACSFGGTRQVRYGANNQYAYRTASGGIGCNNQVFGDPVPGVVKQCEYAHDASTAPSTRPAMNISTNKRTAQSSTAFDAASSRAVDGNSDGNWAQGSVTHTDSQQGAWWMVDLGGEYRIESITVFNRTDCCAERLNAFVAVTANEGWPNNGSVQFQQSLGPPQQAITVSVSPRNGSAAVYGRFVYVVLNTKDFLSLAEVRVMGSPR